MRIMQLIEIQLPVQGHETLDMHRCLKQCGGKWILEEYITCTIWAYFLKATMVLVCTRITRITEKYHTCPTDLILLAKIFHNSYYVLLLRY